MTGKTLDEALKEVLKDDGRVSKFEARVLRELIVADGCVTRDEKEFLQRALENNSFDDQAFDLLSQIVLRAGTK